RPEECREGASSKPSVSRPARSRTTGRGKYPIKNDKKVNNLGIPWDALERACRSSTYALAAEGADLGRSVHGNGVRPKGHPRLRRPPGGVPPVPAPARYLCRGNEQGRRRLGLLRSRGDGLPHPSPVQLRPGGPEAPAALRAALLRRIPRLTRAPSRGSPPEGGHPRSLPPPPLRPGPP